MNRGRVLVVDDEPAMLRSVERVLGTRHDVRSARTADEALARVAEEPFDLGIVDIRMPETDGFELAAQLRETRPDMEIIFMTGIVHELDAQMIRSIRERAFSFIQKPFDRELLITLVERCLELRRLEHENRRYVERLESELDEARSFQRGLLPPVAWSGESLSVVSRCLACEALSGDFVDYVPLGPRDLAVLVADVSGHGVSAAMLLGVVKASFHDAHADDYAPAAVVDRIARGLRTFDDDRFVTAFCARVRGASMDLDFVNAGHPVALLWNRDAERRALTELGLTGPMISPAFPDTEWEERRVELVPGDRLLAFTDGLTEARDDGGFFGHDRLRALVAEHGPALDGARLVELLLEHVDRFRHGRPRDDDESLLWMGVS